MCIRDSVTIEQVAKDFGVHPMTLHKWMRRADIDEGRSPGVSATESAELREARKRILALSPVRLSSIAISSRCLSPIP